MPTVEKDVLHIGLGDPKPALLMPPADKLCCPDDIEPATQMTQATRLSTELIRLLEQQTQAHESKLPGFLSALPRHHPSWGERIRRWFARLAVCRSNEVSEPLIPPDMLSDLPSEMPVSASNSQEPLLQRRAKSTEALIQSARRASQLELPLSLDLNDTLHENFRQCLRSTKTALCISFAQLQEYYGCAQLPIDDPSKTVESAGTKHMACFLLPLNKVAKGVLVDQKRQSIGRNDSPFFSCCSRVVSRRQCQLFRELEQLYIYDVGSQGGTFVNGQRLSAAGQISTTRKLEHLDIVQFGVDYVVAKEGADMQPEPQHCAPQFLVVLGYAREPSRSAKKNSPSPVAIKSSRLNRLVTRARAIPFADGLESKLGCFRLYLELESLFGESLSGWGVLASGAVDQYSLVCNNLQPTWVIGMTQIGADAPGTWLMENVKGKFRIAKDGIKEARLVEGGNDKSFLVPKLYSSSPRAATASHRPQLRIVPPPLFLACGSKSCSPVSLPSPTLSLVPQEQEEDSSQHYYYVIQGHVRSGLCIKAKLPERPVQIVCELGVTREEKSRWGRRRLCVDGRLLLPESLANERPLLLLALVLKSLQQTSQ